MNASALVSAALAVSLLGAAPPDPVGDVAATMMRATHIPGMVVLVVDHDRVTVSRAFGVRNVASATPVDVHTRFEIGSITKQFTAAAILQLAKRGKLRLTDTLGTYVPEYAAAKDVTLAQMLGQVSGIPDYTEVPAFAALVSNDGGTQTLRERGDVGRVIGLIRDRPLAFAPGTRWAYSNTNYYLLGRIVEIASGMSWSDYVSANIFRPAGMTESSFMENEGAVEDMATGYAPVKSALIPTSSFNGWAGGAGAIVATASDLAKWDAALLAGKIVDRADVAAMLRPGTLPAGGRGAHYGYGWMIDTFDGQARAWHNGGTLGFTATNQLYPDLGETVIVFANDGAASADAVANAVFEALHPALAQAASRPAAGEDPAVTARAKRMLADLAAGTVDRSQLSDAFSTFLTPDLLKTVGQQFGALGTPTAWTYTGVGTAGRTTAYTYRVAFTTGVTATATIAIAPDGKVSGFSVRP